eukprot:3579261-Pleurochrysis_carterae.AAC.4
MLRKARHPAALRTEQGSIKKVNGVGRASWRDTQDKQFFIGFGAAWTTVGLLGSPKPTQNICRCDT